VPFDIAAVEQTQVLEKPQAVVGIGLPEKGGVGGIGEDVETAVSVPIRHTEFPAPTAAGGFLVHPKRFVEPGLDIFRTRIFRREVVSPENATRRKEDEFAIAFGPFEKGQV